MDSFEKKYRERVEKSRNLYNGPRYSRPQQQSRPYRNNFPQPSTLRRPYNPNFVPKPNLQRNTYNKSQEVSKNRTEDGRPICFKCNKPGHVARYCRVKFIRILEEDPTDTQEKVEEKCQMNEISEKSGPRLYADVCHSTQTNIPTREKIFRVGRFKLSVAPESVNQSKSTINGIKKLDPKYKLKINVDKIGTFEALVDTGADLSVGDLRTALDTGHGISKLAKICAGPDGKKLDMVGSIFLNIKIDDETLSYNFVILKTHLRTLNLGRDFLKKMNAKIDCKQETIKYDLTNNHDELNFEMLKIKSAKDSIVPECSIKLIKALVETEDGEYIIEESSKMFQTNGLRLARSLINVINRETHIWITNPCPRPLKIMKNQTLAFGSSPAKINVNREREVEENEEPRFQINENLSPKEQKELKQVLERSKIGNATRLGRTNLAKHRIDTEDAKPIKHKPYRVSAKERDIIKEQIDEMLTEGIIRPSSSPWSFPVILVKKRDGKYRFCVDYRKLNNVTVKDVFPIPRIDEVMDTLQGSTYFSAIDLRSGYWQVEVEERDKEKTAFTTAHGLYEFNVMPFGLCNAPATFERNMENMLGNLRWQICLCYLDDVIIYSPDFPTHLKRLEAVFRCFRESNLRLNDKKCRFAFEELEILGYITSKHGIKPAEHNIKAVRNFPRPKKVKEVQSFLGMCSYYGKFIKDFSKFADPLTNLIKKSVSFTWTERQEEAFQTLNTALLSPPILGHFNPNAPTYVHTDASNIDIGATLVQDIGGEEKVRSYLSRTLSKAEQNYSTTEKECLAVVWSMSKLRPYLYGRHFKIVTDHHALCWLKYLKDPTVEKAQTNYLLDYYSPFPQPTFLSKELELTLLVHCHLRKTGKKWIIVLTDYYTRYAEIFLRHGAPQYLFSDTGSQFTSNLMKEVMKICKIKHCFTTSYHPQTNGLTERLNRTLINMLSMYVNTDQKNWDEILPFITHAYNTTIQETTGYSPFFLMFGREPTSLLDDRNISVDIDKDDYDEYIKHHLDKIDRTRKLVINNTIKTQERMKKNYAKKHIERSYEPGELVAVWTPIRKIGKCEKLLRKYFGPYRILKKMSSVNYLIEPKDNPGQDPLIVHVSRIKPYYERMDEVIHEDVTTSGEGEVPSELALHGNVAENWRRFKQRLMLYLEATEKATKPDKLKVAILLNFIGEEALEVFNTFHLKEDEAENFDLVINKFDDFCEPKKNVIFERFKFFSATQKDGESIDSFITELKGLSTSCEFESQKDSLIRDRIVYGIQDKALQERLLREPNLTLIKAIEMCKTDEISKQQIKIMQNNQNICQIRKYEKKHSPKQNQESEKEFKCQRCGKSHRAKNCPAWGKRCSKCKKMNHFAAFCKGSAIRSLNDETEETVWSIHEAKVVHTLEWKKSIIVNGKEICFKLDSGAEVNVLPYTFTRQMKGLEIFQTNRKLTSYTGHEIKIKGIATLNCKTKNKTESLEFFIADGYYQPILGIEAIEKLSLIKKCDAVQTEQNNSAKEILNRHKNIFEGIGRLPIEHKIRLKENATPVIAPSRKIPFSIREKVKAELERMEKLDIIEKVEEPSEWTHPIVVVQKPSGDVRICMDPRELNKYIQRERYILPTAETIFSELKGATVFSVFDASSAFWQVPLDKESTNLCTIATPFGRFRFKRLPYGLNSASEVFQRCINNILSGLQGTACYMDDILIYGSTMEEHNRNLETVLRRLEENNVKLNAKKQQIAVEKVNFLGHIISRDGIAIQASRAEAIQKLKRPENKTEVQRFLGMVTYLGKFIPNLSDKTAPLRKLISNKSEWKFGGEENDCFEKLKDMVSNAPILTFFDPTKPITISSDASQYGIGTVLMQGGHAIEYASFSLNATQRKYAQIEKELLAIVFGCERFQYYIWGNDVIVETDHKPLLSIVKKPLEKLSPRLQRMVLRLMRFQISLKFTPGKNMFVADHLSRDPLKDEVDTSYLEGQTESVHMLLVTTDEKIKRLQKETHGDHTLIQLIEYAKNGWPKYKTMVCDEAKPYWQFQDEIHVSDGIVYKGNCIMVPSTLRKEILQVVHSSHQGIAASKEKARSAFYWPGMITQVENEVEKCRTCQEYSRKNPEESRIAHEIPEFPWEKIAVDFMEVSGTSSILVVDYHSKFVEIRKLSSKRETETILQLKTIFRTHGIPRTLVSDNGPPFNSTGFKNFAQKYEFKHQTSSPKYPRSNGQVERTIQTIKGLIIKAVKSGRDPNLALMEFNNTPKYDLPSPTQMLMGRSVRTLSTYTRQQLKPLFDTTKNYQKLRDHQQKYSGSPKRILRPLEVGDNIMLQERHRKWVPATVTAKHETPRSYMVKTPSGSEYRRN
ncbi:K02A2.6-like, partial [Cordylochernes scorpioides]